MMQSAARRCVRKPQMREKQFKRVAFFSTILGIVLIAVGLQRLLVAGSWLQLALLAPLGVAVALVSVMIDVIPEPGFVITLYTREGCTLCEAARAFLVGKKSEYDYDLWEVDVDSDPRWTKYSDWVPVAIATTGARRRGRRHGGTADEEELFRAMPDYVKLEARLRALADRRLRR